MKSRFGLKSTPPAPDYASLSEVADFLMERDWQARQEERSVATATGSGKRAQTWSLYRSVYSSQKVLVSGALLTYVHDRSGDDTMFPFYEELHCHKVAPRRFAVTRVQ